MTQRKPHQSFSGLLSSLFARRRRYDDLAVSIEEHIAEKVEELVDDGMPRAQAEQAARRAFGNVTLLQERSREQWQWPRIESILADLRLIFRRLRKAPGFATTVLLTLAIGLGANTVVFSVINRVLLRPLPYPDSSRLVSLWLNAPGAGGLANFSSGLQLSPSMYFTFLRHNHTLQSLGIWSPGDASITGVAQPEEVHGIGVSDGVLQSLQVPPVAGRWFTRADQDPRGAKTVILSYGYWQRRFGGDRSVIGRVLQVDSEPRTIVGVMPRNFRIADSPFEILLPLALDPINEKLAGFGFNGIARLRPGVSIAQADADIARLIPVWMDSWTNGPGTNPHYYTVWRIAPSFHSLKQQVIGNVGSVLWIVMATVGLVLLIACANIANLLLVRADSRQQELSIRAALGAGRARIARELLLESVVLGLLGGLLSLAVAWGGLRLLVAFGPADLPRISEISLDPRSLAFTFLLAALSGLLFGAIPAWRYARSRLSLILGSSARTASASRAHHRSRNILVIAQTAMALVLLIGALLMIRTFAALRNVDPGFSDPAHIQTFGVWIPEQLIPNPLLVARTQSNIANQFAAIPGVQAVGFAAAVPMDNDDPDWDEIQVEGKIYPANEPPLRLYNYVSPGFFHAMGTRFVAGRDFTWSDLYGVHPYVIVSEGFARDAWGSAAAAIDKRIRKYSHSPWQQVIGVVEDVHVHGVDEVAPPIVYWPAMYYDRFASPPVLDGLRAVTFAVRSSQAGSAAFIGRLQQALWSVNGNLPLDQVRTMQDLYDQSMGRTSFTLVMLAIAGFMALALSIIGIYGVMAYTVSQRSREIGIRLALGAPRSALRWIFVRSALVLTGIGGLIGLAAAALLTESMRTLLFGITPLDPVTWATVPVVLAAAAVLASYLPARRAAAVDPAEVLRAE
ncbi:MAG TPA: ABC transporter permease [Acidobacteriaceae bacterium]|jgi:predicted permease|nr:ABC transporter permease [Acidobacteriaceae bacterium]